MSVPMPSSTGRFILTDALKIKAKMISEDMNQQGMRVLAVSQKSFIEKDCNFAIEDEKEMVLIGYLAFLDPPKPSAVEAIEQLYAHGVAVKFYRETMIL